MSNSKAIKQIIFWEGRKGGEYTDRNPQSIKELSKLYLDQYGVSRATMNKRFLGGLPRHTKILEVGANIGLQMEAIRKMGFKNIVGIDINNYSVKKAKSIHPNVDIIKGSAFDMPFRDGYFDLVFTSGVLIHISPKNINKALDEILRTTRQYIWGLEYFASKREEVVYRGKKNLLWKADFPALYLKRFPGLKLVKEERFPMRETENVSQMFLLKKK